MGLLSAGPLHKFLSRRQPCGLCGCMGPLSAGPPCSLHIGDGLVGHVSVWSRFPRVLLTVSTLKMALWAMWVYGPAFRGSSPQSSHRRWPCGPRERMVPLSAGPPHSLHIGDSPVGYVGVWSCFPQVLPTVSTSEMALWALWVYGPAFRRSSPQSPNAYICERDWPCGPWVRHELHGRALSTHLPQYKGELQGRPCGSLEVGWAHRQGVLPPPLLLGFYLEI